MGAIEKDKEADMVLLTANPLDDIRNTTKNLRRVLARQVLSPSNSGSNPSRQVIRVHPRSFTAIKPSGRINSNRSRVRA